VLLTCDDEWNRLARFVLRRCLGWDSRCFRRGNIALACGYRKAHTACDEVITPVSQVISVRRPPGGRPVGLRYTGAIKRTYQPKKRYRRRVHGFLRRMSTRGGAHVLRNRRRKGRQRLA